MIRKIASFAYKILPSNITEMKKNYGILRRKNPSMSVLKLLLKGKLIQSNSNIYFMDDYANQFMMICKLIEIKTNFGYIYPFDSKILRVYDRAIISSVTVDYDTVLTSNLNIIKKQLFSCTDNSFKKRELVIIDAIELLAKRIHDELINSKDERERQLGGLFPSILYDTPRSFDEAIQKLLFYNALFWQMGHYHMGLGRLDNILSAYYEKDVEKGVLNYEKAKQLLTNLILVLGKDMPAKSPELIGDTGQYILLGGIGKEGINVDNVLSEMILEIMKELRIPDPKLIIRVNEYTSDTMWKKAIECILTGIGSPLIMDEKPIMQKMKDFGYSPTDIWNMGTSACWEPLIIGKSFDQNNPYRSAVALKPLNDIIMSGRNFNSFTELIDEYKKGLAMEIRSVIKDIDFDCSPLLTLFFDDCLTKAKDFSRGGAVYSYHGAQIVSFPNTINALLNIRRLVFEEKMYTLEKCREAIINNFNQMEDFRILLFSRGKKFGSTDEDVVGLTNDLIQYVSKVVRDLKSNGNKVKIGFSSPNYINESRHYIASLDGRKEGDPFAVHLSPISSSIDLSEILDFSSALNYNDNCINGNVVDFILPSSYIKQPLKLVQILKNACSKGIFELQLNVLDKATLVDAKKHPEKYPNLVVRVWGFSAYFNDLPEEFKDNLIRRAEIYETA